MANKSIMLVCVLVTAAIFMAGAPKAEATTRTHVSSIQGTVFCAANGSICVNGTATPIFPNAQVELRCGDNNQVMASGTTNSHGAFTLVAAQNTLQNLLLPLPSGCRVVVTTPLSACNATLPSTGRLVSTSITDINTVNGGILTTICNFGVPGFTFLVGVN